MKKLTSILILLYITGSNIFAQNELPSIGNVGIGTNSPSTLLHLRKDNNTVLSPSLITSSDISGMRFSNLSTIANAGAVLNFQLGGTGTAMAAIAATRPSANNSSIHFFTESANSVGERMIITSAGNVGIGTNSPSGRLSILRGPTNSGSKTWNSLNQASIDFYADSQDGYNRYLDISAIGQVSGGNGGSNIRFITNPGNSNTGIQRMLIDSDGNVGIGTDDPQSKLAVNGQIRATEVKVLADISVPDYVFEPDYDLRTLKETQAYIKEHKHLPEIPSAKEIGENGIDLGDMNMRLLKKIEELTLYQIELLERLEEQNGRLLEQQKRIEKLEKEG